MATMQVLKVVAEGLVTSFRYPHFMWQKQPSYELPPPATIYGHLCSAMGEWLDPRGLRFAYHFTYSGKVEDMEHIHAGNTVMPFHRELLFQLRLTLYLNRPEWEQAFRQPRYVVVLGRSQDLFTYTSVSQITVEQTERAYYEHTLLPYDDWSTRVLAGNAAMMPRFVDYTRRREASFGRYLALSSKIVDDPDTIGKDSNRVRRYADSPLPWVDPEVRDRNTLARGLVWHSFVEDNYDYEPAELPYLPA